MQDHSRTPPTNTSNGTEHKTKIDDVIEEGREVARSTYSQYVTRLLFHFADQFWTRVFVVRPEQSHFYL